VKESGGWGEAVQVGHMGLERSLQVDDFPFDLDQFAGVPLGCSPEGHPRDRYTIEFVLRRQAGVVTACQDHKLKTAIAEVDHEPMRKQLGTADIRPELLTPD
jgi:hypothetical protein